ncbi:MAG: putative sulfate/molybdate transporter [Methanoculleus sp.]|uniref:putative sulfate/molybdate transporter n=2 Tax=Methanoculleus TaxID=45989 RepID=UPI0025FDF555|nr:MULTISPECIES: putative sulfate/molybdate transporter [unclassified Methanoculleus]MCK9317596.1 putative sulfate/molybdate transporter [Methanoculleus sp.]MDD2254115.1 putative sulfate/molybdate transporter [Methanoculleus sp.]MDD3215872.1 putative sulfate/molybdate transporter [Methanoculleus sp.]MDD4314219.1 putative sulfate/molybdate transporter [Methanoculleus sp.]MDD4470391.1 putative sulfate/molybdate transporter [Methanoculleus sp.]
MAESGGTEERGIRFTLEEVAGAVGDFGTIFPILLGVAIVCPDVNVSHFFLFLAAWFIITGLYYRLPIPIEPMKAIGAVVIAEGLCAGEIVASGLVVGALFLIIGLVGGMAWLEDRIPKSVIRGVQAGLALLLLRTSLGYIVADTLVAMLAIAVIVVFFIASQRTRIPDVSALLVLIIGLAAGIAVQGMPPFRLMPLPALVLPVPSDFITGTWDLVLPQVPLTIANAILATSLLTYDLFPKKGVDPDRLSRTIGAMNLVSTPLGGFPMCHGAGGLAAMYRFGARTGGANIVAGIFILIFAVAFAPPEVLTLIPFGVFGALLVFVALELGKHSAKTESYLVTAVIAVLTLAIGLTVAFIVGMVLAYVLQWRAGRRQPGS